MTNEPQSSDRSDDDVLASEYVLGVLDAHERTECAVRIERDPGFARLVADWEQRLSGMNDAYAETVPSPAVKTRIDRRLFGEPEQAPSGLWSSLTFWRLFTGAALAGLAALIVVGVTDRQAPGPSLVAGLQSADTDIRFVAMFDEAAGTLRLSQIGGHSPADQDFELWLIAGDNPPASLGLVTGRTAPAIVSAGLVGGFLEGTALAVSLEPAGGSPTGAPTGPVVAQGILKKI